VAATSEKAWHSNLGNAVLGKKSTKGRLGLKEFDYFDQELEIAAPVGSDSGLGGMERQLGIYHQRRKRYSRFLLLMTFTCASCVWFLWDYRADFRYHLATSAVAQAMGDVTALRPRDLVPNSYVSIEGITEHRGMVQKRVRGLGLARQERWYFRLLGSHGIFIEVEPDKERFDIVTQVKVAGRVVDFKKDPGFSRLLGHYHHKYQPERMRDMRMIEVGRIPGDNRFPYLFTLGLMGLLFLSNGLALVKWLKLRRVIPLIGGKR
jgi:hypothetical protein